MGIPEPLPPPAPEEQRCVELCGLSVNIYLPLEMQILIPSPLGGTDFAKGSGGWMDISVGRLRWTTSRLSPVGKRVSGTWPCQVRSGTGAMPWRRRRGL